MEKPLLVLKPSIINALIPIFLKYLFYSTIFVALLFWLSFLLEKFNIIESPANKIFWSVILLLVILAGPVIVNTILLGSTTYYFFRTYITRELKFIIIKKHSVPYAQITNISTDISIWDRLCKAGDITLYTAEDNAPNLVLNYISRPQKIEKKIYNVMQINNKSVSN